MIPELKISKLDKLKQYTTVEIPELLQDENTFFFPRIKMNTWQEHREIEFYPVMSPHYRTDPDLNNSLRIFAVDPENRDELIGIRTVHFYNPGLPYFYTAEGAIATNGNFEGVGTILESVSQFVIKNLASFININNSATISYRSIDENLKDLVQLEEFVLENPQFESLLVQKQNERQAWERLFGEKGLFGYRRSRDDSNYIEIDYRVSEPNQKLINAVELKLIREIRNHSSTKVEVLKSSPSIDFEEISLDRSNLFSEIENLRIN